MIIRFNLVHSSCVGPDIAVKDTLEAHGVLPQVSVQMLLFAQDDNAGSSAARSVRILSTGSTA